MPNWVFNTITSDPETIKDIAKRFINNNGDFDFNYLVPMPKALDVEEGWHNDEDMYYFLSDHNTIPLEKVAEIPNARLIKNDFAGDRWLNEIARRVEDNIKNGRAPNYEMGRRLIDNWFKYKATTWYHWRYDNWNTKWNACNTVVNEETISFDTAWDVPVPILEKLCMIYPDKSIGIYSEEETGWYVEFENVDGVLTKTDDGELPVMDETEDEQ